MDLSIDLKTIVSTLTTLLVGLFAFVVYRIEKTDKDKSAASIVLEEIRAIEKNIDKLKEIKNLVNIVPSVPAFSTSGWYGYRHLLIKYLDSDETSQLSSFFERVEELKEILNQWRQLYFGGMRAKNTKIQEKLVDIANDSKDKEYYEIQKKKTTDLLHSDAYWFEPFIYKDIITAKLSLLNPISTTIIAEKLKKIGKKGWLTNRI